MDAPFPPLMPGSAWLNGVYCALDELRVSPLDAGFLYGDGLFETLRTYGGRPAFLGRHLSRLAGGAESLGLPGLPPLEGVVVEVIRRAGFPECTVRLTVTRGVGTAGLSPAGFGAPTALVTAQPLRTWPADVYARGARVGLMWRRSAEAWPRPGVKSTSYQGAVMARREAAARGWDEGLYLDASGLHVTEGAASNVFAVVGARLWTPPSDVCLPGVTRGELLRLASEVGLVVEEAPLPCEVLGQADEVLLTSALAGVVPVTEVDGAKVGRGVPGPAWSALRARYLEEAAKA
jgi:branched-chain amino acid aminotransferase